MKSNLFFRISYQSSRWLLAALLLFSGFAKAINPFGLSLQFSDYFAAMGLQFLQPIAPISAILLPVVEIVLGIMIATHLFRRVTAMVTLVSMSFFTLLTLWIATTNPVSDCGCFGDILIISNWATFLKNLFFTAAAVILFIGRKGSMDRRNWQTVLSATLISGALPLYCYNYLPLIDATPYKIGVNIYDEIHRIDSDKTTTTLIYRDLQTGKTQEFSIIDTTWHDTSRWQFIDQHTELISKGAESKIKALPMIDKYGTDQSDSVLSDKGRIAIIVSVNPTPISPLITEAIGRARLDGANRIILLHSSSRNISLPEVEVYVSDYSTLHTIIQNRYGGTITLVDGVIVNKSSL